MQTQRINITLPVNVIKQLKAAVPARKRSGFIASVVAEKLEKKKNLKEEFERSLQANKEFYKNEYKVWKALEVEGWPE